MFPYAETFRAIEASLKEQAARHLSLATVEQKLAEYRNAGRTLDDEETWRLLVSVIFYAGFKAEIVSQKESEIYRHLGNVRRVANLAEGDIEQILADPKMIRNRRKVKACVENARRFLNLTQEHGSFRSFVTSFEPELSFEGLFLLKE